MPDRIAPPRPAPPVVEPSRLPAPPGPRVSVIIPVLDEQARIAGLLDAFGRIGPLHEIIVVDGGSGDRTVELAEAGGTCRVIRAGRGRGPQMNAGARAATGDVLWFVHADVRPSAEALAALSQAMADPDLAAGAFHIRTMADGRPGRAARWLGLADLRSRYTRLPYGDQAMFVRRDVFDRVGGFPEQPLFEDLELSRRLQRAGSSVRTLPVSIDVSGRRFLARPVYYAILMNVLPILYRLGVPAGTLAAVYRTVR